MVSVFSARCQTLSLRVFRLLGTLDHGTKQEDILEIIDELKEKHGSNILSLYKFRLWAEMIVRIIITDIDINL